MHPKHKLHVFLGPVHMEVGQPGRLGQPTRWDEFFRAFTWENFVLAAGMCFVTLSLAREYSNV